MRFGGGVRVVRLCEGHLQPTIGRVLASERAVTWSLSPAVCAKQINNAQLSMELGSIWVHGVMLTFTSAVAAG
jgi:hypothetical protein